MFTSLGWNGIAFESAYVPKVQINKKLDCFILLQMFSTLE